MVNEIGIGILLYIIILFYCLKYSYNWIDRQYDQFLYKNDNDYRYYRYLFKRLEELEQYDVL